MGKEWNTATATTGAVHEMMVACDLMRHGFSLFRALSPACSCDLIAIDPDGKLVRVEVKTGYVGATGRVNSPKADPARFDMLAVVVNGDRIYYSPNPY